MTYNANFYSKFTKKHINQAFVDACINGDLEKAKFLLNSPELQHRADISYNENTALHQACEHNHLHIMQYLLTSPELKVHADIHSKDDWALTIACNEGHFEIVKYLLTSPDLKEHSHFNVDQIRYALHIGEFDIVDYLLNSSDLKKNFDIHMQEDTIFKQFCQFGDMGNLKYLIHDLDIEITEEINNYLAKPPSRKQSLVNEAKNMFELRELNKQLNQNLNENIESKKKPKL
jgi:ankyrin repeat protein